MKLVMMNGGLGNQVFQYIFARYIEEKLGEECMLEDLWFHTPLSGKKNEIGLYYPVYEIEQVWGIKRDLLSSHFDSEALAEMSRLVFPSGDPMSLCIPDPNCTSVVKILRDSGIHLGVVEEGGTYRSWGYDGPAYTVPMNEFDPGMLRCTGDYYYFGWWINGHWFAEIRDKIWKELEFPEPSDAQNKAYLSEIRATESISIHVRRDIGPQHLVTESSIYCELINQMKKAVKKPTFFIFSDDMPWVKEHLREIGILPQDRYILVEGNSGINSYVDMQLMSNCKGMIVTNSSFSYLAALLNQNLKHYAGYSGRQVPGIHF